MPKVNCYMSEDAVNDVKELAQKENKNFSRMMAELVDIGLRVKNRSNENEQDKELTEEEKWELLYRKMCYAQVQTLELVKDIYTANCDPKTVSCNSPEERFKLLTTQVKGYIDGLLEEVSASN